MASSFLKGLVTDYGKLGYQLWHRPLKMASLVYEGEIGIGGMVDSLSVDLSLPTKAAVSLKETLIT